MAAHCKASGQKWESARHQDNNDDQQGLHNLSVQIQPAHRPAILLQREFTTFHKRILRPWSSSTNAVGIQKKDALIILKNETCGSSAPRFPMEICSKPSFYQFIGVSWGKILIEAKHSPEIHLQSPPIVPLKQVLHLVLDSQYRQPSASFLHQAKVASASLKEIAPAIRDMTKVLSHISRQTERQQRAPVFGSRKTSNTVSSN